MAPLAEHCAPRRPGEPFVQYLDRFKAWQSRRDRRNLQKSGERRAIRAARLPTPESSSDSNSDSNSDHNSGHNSDHNSNSSSDNDNNSDNNSVTGHGHGHPPQSATSRHSHQPSPPPLPQPFTPALAVAPSFPPSELPAISPTSATSHPFSPLSQSTAPAPSRPTNTLQPQAQTTNNRISKPRALCLRSRARLTRTPLRFFELDDRGHPRLMASSPGTSGPLVGQSGRGTGG
ncbi:hypothetical protein B0H67DRAFT_558518 [Lasiosphaeris hirsuta]|uniref:Uncharacterized protein n=1 Tax=Lasiosphaeris hirsuta TaxID=260670 RepID=A0AA39ZRD1_9PEZI|nr:hypothetical protein B0H67DRAFT_558518 [Lasiosphaeris hirsuta]